MLKRGLKQPRHMQRGTSLLEVLVAMLLLSLAVLPLASLHARALQNTRTAQYRATASQLALDWSERLRANAVAAQAGAYDVQLRAEDFPQADASTVCADTTRCTPEEIASRDVAQWRHAARAAALPGMDMSSARDGSRPGAMNIRIGWTQPAMVGAAPDPQTLNVSVAL